MESLTSSYSTNQQAATLMKLNRISFGVKCYVRSTEGCRKLFEGLGMTPADYLRPFGLMGKRIDLTSVNGKKRTVTNFQVNMIDDYEFRAPTKQQAEAVMHRVLEQNVPNLSSIHTAYKTREQVGQHLEAGKTVWYDKSSEVILEHSRFAHAFTFTDQPVCLINFFTVDESDPSRTVQQLEQESAMHLKEIFKNNPTELNSQNIIRANFIIYDSSSKRQMDLAAQILQTLRVKYEYCFNRVIPINSQAANTELQQWEPTIDNRYNQNITSPLDRKRKILDGNDSQKISDIFAELIPKIVQGMDAKLKQYHQLYVSQKKTSLSSTFKKLFNKNDQKPESGGAYLMSPFEALVRNIGDILYFLHDYELAIDFYKQCAEAFKNKSYRHYASALEMWAMCSVMLHHEMKINYSKNEAQTIFNQLNEAVQQYSYQVGHIHFSLRVIVFKMLAQHLYDKFDSIINLQVYDVGHLIKERGDTPKANHYPIFQALLQEQFSIMHLKQKPIRARKYCQNMMYSGYQFGKCKLKLHALRCYLIIEKEYENAQWSALQDYLYKQLAKFYIEISMFERSFDYIKLLLKNINKRDSKDKHSQTLLDTTTFLSFFDRFPQFDYSAGLENAEYIPLPSINQRSVDIIMPDEVIVDGYSYKFQTLSSVSQPGIIRGIDVAQRDTTNLVWSEMGLRLLNSSNEKQNMTRAEIERETCTIKSLAALCVEDKVTAFDIRGAETSQSRIGYVDEIITVKFELTNPMKMAFRIEDFCLFYEFTPEGSQESSKASEFIKEQKKSFEIGEEKKLQVSIKIVPSCPGFLHIRGLQWNVFKIPVTFEFDVKGKLTSDATSRLNNFSNRVRIMESTGKLSLKAIDFEDTICFGGIKTLNFELKNDGTSALSDIRLMFSEPYIYGKHHQDLEGVTIAPGQTAMHKLHIRTSNSKECAIKILVAYKTEGNKYFRYTRFFHVIPVNPSFTLVFFTQTLYDQSSILLKIDEEFHKNFLGDKSSVSTASTRQSSSSSLTPKAAGAQPQQINLLDLDMPSQEDNSIPNLLFDEPSTQEPQLGLKFHQLILIDNNWRFMQLPYEVVSQEKGYYYNIQLQKLSQSRRKTSHQVNHNLIDLLEDEVTQAEQTQATSAVGGTEMYLTDVEESDMHFMNLDRKEILNTYAPIQGFGCDFTAIRNYINYDRQLLFDRFWDKEADFDHPDLVSITVAWTYRTPDKVFSGLHSLPKVKMNRDAPSHPRRKLNPLDTFPLFIELEYQQQVTHDFSVDPVCCVDVKVKLKNMHSQEKLSFLFQSIGSDEQFSTANDEQFPFFVWEGETDKCISGLEHQAEQVISLRACFTSGGLYSINRFKYSFYASKDNKQLLDPSVGRNAYLGNNKVDARSYLSSDREQYFLNIVSAN